MITENKLSGRIGAVAGKVPGVALVVVGPEGIRARASTGYADLSSVTTVMIDEF
jgi:hypothetical protein